MAVTSGTPSHNISGDKPSAPASRLAPELILHIFELLDDYQDVVALNLASTRYYNVWFMNTASISEAVLNRSIKCFYDARELLRAQERFTNGEEGRSARQMILLQNKVLISNARQVAGYRSGVSGLIDNLYPLGGSPPYLKTRHEIFLHFYYRLYVAVVLRKDPEAQEAYLVATDPNDLRRMALMAEWLDHNDWLRRIQEERTPLD